MLNSGRLNSFPVGGDSTDLTFTASPVIRFKQSVVYERASSSVINFKQSVGEGMLSRAIINFNQIVNLNATYTSTGSVITFLQKVNNEQASKVPIKFIQRVYDE